MEKADTNYCRNVTCPHCGFEDEDSWEYSEDYYKDVTCQECNKHFAMERDVDITYSTYPL